MNSINVVEIVYNLHNFCIVNIIKTKMTYQNTLNKALSLSILNMNYNEIFLFSVFFYNF
jgi:hypothetical protein